MLLVVLVGLMSVGVVSAQAPTFLRKWGSRGTGDGQFRVPHGVAVDAAGNVYVVDGDNDRIQVFSPDATPPDLTVPADITRDATSLAGAMVTYAATATDNVSGAVTPTCSPASGGTFPVGATTVNCGAKDAAGNTTSKTFLVTVKGDCGRAVATRVEGDLIVPGGKICVLTGTAVSGSVKAGPGASLGLKGATIGGNLQVDEAVAVDVRDTSVTGNVQVKKVGGPGPVVLLDSRIRGNVQVEENAVGHQIERNVIDGDLQFHNNRDSKHVIADNKIGGSLQCKENVPPPVGGGNTAKQKEDQCAKL